MGHSIRSVLLTCALLVLGASNPARATLITNGSFDDFVPSNATGGSWTTSHIDANGGWRSTTSENSFENFFIINENGPVNSDPSLSQTIAGLVVGQSYTVTGEFESFRPSDGNPAARAFGVEIVGLVLTEYRRPPSLLGSFELEFVATSATHVLRLTAERNGDDSAYAVDNIAMIETPPVAEPGAALSLAGGLGLLAAARRWR